MHSFLHSFLIIECSKPESKAYPIEEEEEEEDRKRRRRQETFLIFYNILFCDIYQGVRIQSIVVLFFCRVSNILVGLGCSRKLQGISHLIICSQSRSYHVDFRETILPIRNFKEYLLSCGGLARLLFLLLFPKILAQETLNISDLSKSCFSLNGDVFSGVHLIYKNSFSANFQLKLKFIC